MTKKQRNHITTFFGVLTSLCTAYGIIDFNSFDIKKEWIKLVIIGIPAIGGYFTILKSKDEK